MSIQEIGDVLTGLKNQSLLGKSSQKEGAFGQYDPNCCPPDFDLAMQHGKSKKVYKAIKLEEGKREACPCCQLPLKGEKIPINAELSELYHLGSGYPLYFQFIKYSIALLTLFFIGGGAFGIITNAFGDSCASPSETDGVTQYCVKNFVGFLTIANKRDRESALEVQLILNFVTIVLAILFFHYVRFEVRKVRIDADDQTVTPSDYTLKLSNVPLDVKSSAIKDWIESFGNPKSPVTVRKVCRSYNIIEYMQLLQENENLLEEKVTESDDAKRGVLEARINEIQQKLQNLKQKDLKFARVVYITMETAQQADQVAKEFRRGLFNRGVLFMKRIAKGKTNKLNGRKIKIKRAPEPSDVLWENLGFSQGEKFKRRIFTGIMAGVLVLMSFGLIITISWGQNEILRKVGEHSRWIQVLSIAASFLLTIVNYILGQSIRKLSEFEKHGTYTGYFTGITRKLSVSQFINTAFTTLVAKIVITASLDSGDHRIIETVNFYGVGGLLEAMFYVFLTNAFSTPMMNLFDPWYYMKLFSRWRVLKNSQNSQMLQKDANALFEDPQVDMSYKYALLIKTMLLTAFYAPAIPISILIAIAGLALVYWVDKYILLRRAALPFSLGYELTDSMIEYLEWMTLMYSVGNILVVYSLQDSEGHLAFRTVPIFWVWATLVISVLHIFLPMDLINKKLFPIADEVTENVTYDQARGEFYTDYDVENPITRERAMRDFQKALKGSVGKSNFFKRLQTLQVDDEESHFVHEKVKEEDEDNEDKAQLSEALFGVLEKYAKNTGPNPVLSKQGTLQRQQTGLNKSLVKQDAGNNDQIDESQNP